jgi:hypothetical protein
MLNCGAMQAAEEFDMFDMEQTIARSCQGDQVTRRYGIKREGVFNDRVFIVAQNRVRLFSVIGRNRTDGDRIDIVTIQQ